MNTKTKKNARRFSRIPFNATVRLYFLPEEKPHNVQLRDISLRGALVEMEKHSGAIMQGKACRLVLVLGGGEQIAMEGRVARQEGRLLGVECMHTDVDSMTNLRHLVELNMADAIRMQKELSGILK